MLILMVYTTPEALLHAAAAAANEPDGSGKAYQWSVTGPLPEEPQAAINAVIAIAATPTAIRRGKRSHLTTGRLTASRLEGSLWTSLLDTGWTRVWYRFRPPPNPGN